MINRFVATYLKDATKRLLGISHTNARIDALSARVSQLAEGHTESAPPVRAAVRSPINLALFRVEG